MPLSKPVLDAIQKGGAALSQANVSVQAEMQRLNQSLMAALAQAPSGPQLEGIIKDLKAMAGVYHQLQQVDEMLRQVFDTVANLEPHRVEVIQAIAHQPKATATAAGVVDVEPTVKSRRGPAPGKTKAKAQSKSRPRGAQAKLLQYLEKALNAHAWTHISQVDMAKGAEISVGSVNTHLKSLINQKLVLAEGNGQYKLAAAKG